MDISIFILVISVIVLLLLFTRWKRNHWIDKNSTTAFRALNQTIGGKKWLGVRLKLLANIPIEWDETQPAWSKRFTQLCISTENEYLLLVVSLNGSQETIKIKSVEILPEADAKAWLTNQKI